jgi:hypothetical protein
MSCWAALLQLLGGETIGMEDDSSLKWMIMENAQLSSKLNWKVF